MALESVTHISDLVVTNPTSLDMTPALPAHDAMALLGANAIFCAKLGERNSTASISIADRLYQFFSELNHAMLDSTLSCKTLPRMKNILSVRDPLQIVNTIVRWVEVNMIDFAAFRRFREKCLGNKSMNKFALFMPIHAKLDASMTIGAVVRLENSIAVAFPMHLADASNAPKVGYVIPRFVAWDWLPSFFHDQSPLIDSLRVWLRGSRHGDRFSGATLASQGVF